MLDFDPVPVACDVTAIDKTRGQRTLFTETEGYILTDDIRNYCVLRRAKRFADLHDRAPEVIRLFNFPSR